MDDTAATRGPPVASVAVDEMLAEAYTDRRMDAPCCAVARREPV